MPNRKAPTVRQRRLGTELRKLREHAGLSPAAAGQLIGTDRTNIVNVESGRSGVSGERARLWSAHYGSTDAAYIEALAAMAEERSSGWWEEYRGQLPAAALDLAELESRATALRSVQIMHVPGLLQTEEYASAVFEQAVPPLTPPGLRRELSYRLKRRDVLDRPGPPLCTFLVHEAALRMQFGGPKVAKAQLKRLLAQSERENVTVRVIPFPSGFPNAGSSTLYASGVVPQLDTVQIDTAQGPGFVDAETRLENYRALLDRTESKSLDPDESRDFIHNKAQEI
ncbi:helix-turn-helix transcriptional regulator [Streptomyces sp. NPDC001941]|uniref:helix-turn-helix domain-containing protein n=1 Tax=Streptomyces sp. NPDC001941 TaxID=3154659 RepID=UPI00331DA800